MAILGLIRQCRVPALARGGPSHASARARAGGPRKSLREPSSPSVIQPWAEFAERLQLFLAARTHSNDFSLRISTQIFHAMAIQIFRDHGRHSFSAHNFPAALSNGTRELQIHFSPAQGDCKYISVRHKEAANTFQSGVRATRNSKDRRGR